MDALPVLSCYFLRKAVSLPIKILVSLCSLPTLPALRISFRIFNLSQTRLNTMMTYGGLAQKHSSNGGRMTTGISAFDSLQA